MAYKILTPVLKAVGLIGVSLARGSGTSPSGASRALILRYSLSNVSIGVGDLPRAALCQEFQKHKELK